MSESILLVARGGRWTEGCGRLVRECRPNRLSRTSSRCITSETWSKLSWSSPLTPGTISRQLTSRRSLGGFFSRLRESLRPKIPLSTAICGPWRTASTVAKRDAVENEYEFLAINYDPNTNHSTQASLTLQKLLGIQAGEADLYVEKHQSYAVIEPECIFQNYEVCLNAGLSKEAIKQNLEILSIPSNILKTKIQLVARLNIPSINDAVPFFKVRSSRLRLFSNKIQYENIVYRGKNRIIYLTEQLQCPMLSTCQVVAKHYFMQTVAFSKLCQVLRIMLDFHVTKDDILNDAWAFRYNPDIITERLKRVTDAGVHPVKPWMVRCPEHALLKRIGKEIRRRSVLGDQGTIIDYLSRRFECDRKAITALIDKIPKIAHVSGPKMKQVVDFLLENGFTIEDVTRSPKVFFRRVETMQEWLKELQECGHRPKNLLVFVKSKQQYNDYLKTIKSKCLQTNSQ